jgi:protein tyrosine phosphatase (PTP) superfamily phosphohydrolase (DUF442 family)
MPENIDEFIARVQRDELEEQQWMTPVAYSHVRPISSPQIYQLARNGKLIDSDGIPLLEYCRCGRRVLNVKKADIFFSERRNDWPVKPGEEGDDA